jgi:hypothetical protein
MFITNEAHRHPFLSQFCPSGLHYWQIAELEFNRPWFMIGIQTVLENPPRGGTPPSITTTMLVAEIEDLIGICDAEARSRTVKWISVLRPEKESSHAGGWALEQVSAIWSTEMPTGKRDGYKKSYFFETGSGEHLASNPSDEESCAKSRMTLVRRLKA